MLVSSICLVAALCLPALAQRQLPSTISYRQECRRQGLQTAMVRKVTTKSGAQRKLPHKRRLAEVRSDMQGLQRYMSHVGQDTVEIIFNAHSSASGHMLVRAGEKVYDLGNTRMANARYVTSLSGRSGMVGAVYHVPREQVPAIQRRLQSWVDAARATNLPLFDGYGKPVTLNPDGNHFKVAPSRGRRMFRASGLVQARLVHKDGKPVLQAEGHPDVCFPTRPRKNGSVNVDTLTCTSFVFRALQETAPQLGFDRMGDFGTRFARSAIVKLARGKAPKTPDLITVYTSPHSYGGQRDIRDVFASIGKKRSW